MSDQPGIPAITVFPPFNPAPRQADPAPQPVRDQAPAQPEEAPATPPAPSWDTAAPAAPMPWDFEAPAPGETAAASEPQAPAATDAAEMDDDEQDGPAVSDEEDLPWLEVPTPRAAAAEPQQAEIKAEDRPNFADWMRTEDQAPLPPEASAGDDDAGVMPVEELQGDAAEDAWTDGAAGEDEPWKPSPSADEAWQSPQSDEPAWAVPSPALEIPEPELYDLPEVAPAAGATSTPAADAEPAWEMPAPEAGEPSAPAAGTDAAPAVDPFAGVAYRLEQAAAALRDNPQAFAAGGDSADPLDVLLTGFVLGWQAAQRGA